MDSKCVDFVLIIPCYNNIEGLKKSIKSINYFNDKFEIFIIDDGSITPISLTDVYDVNPFISVRLIR
ncbi:MAG: glycosyltransferase, partial [Bacteroidia bacterium]